MKPLIIGITAISVLAQQAWSAEMRVWMSRQGGTLEAELVSIDGENVTLSTKESRQMKLKINDLSLADRQHLVEVGGAPESIITAGKPGLVEKDVRIDTKTFKRLDDKLTFGNESEGFDLFETPHFLIGTAGKARPQAVAETAERLWHGMAFQHMNFRRDWEDKRQLILMAEDRGVFSGLGKWYADFLAGEQRQDAAQRVSATWERVGSTTVLLPEDMKSKYKLNDAALVFNIKSDDDSFRKDLSPFPTHGIADCLITKQLGGVSSYGSEGYFAVTTGHAFFKEISLAGKSETNLISVSGSGNDEIASKRGFEDGTSWARTLKPLVKRGKVKVELAPMLKWKSDQLTPERLVLIYSFAYYMQSDSKRLAEFAKMVRRVESSKQIPAPEEIAKIFGFASVAEFEADWSKFITEGDFK